jgi:hypothetical protein
VFKGKKKQPPARESGAAAKMGKESERADREDLAAIVVAA